MNSDLLRVLIVDDEALGRHAVRRHVERDARFTIVGECSGGQEAIEAIESSPPDLVFLDIQMPEVDGFDVLVSLGDRMPRTVMVTAFDQYAIRAFDHHALDYLLKPIDGDRFRETLDRAVQAMQTSTETEGVPQIAQLISALGGAVASDRQRFTVRTQRSLVCFAADELESVEAAGNYVKLMIDGDEHLVRDTLSSWSDRLAAEVREFSQIHRSILVNRNHVRELRPSSGGSDAVVVLRSGRELPVARRWRGDLEQLLLAGE